MRRGAVCINVLCALNIDGCEVGGGLDKVKGEGCDRPSGAGDGCNLHYMLCIMPPTNSMQGKSSSVDIEQSSQCWVGRDQPHCICGWWW